MSKKKRVVVIGGGTGTFTALKGLKKYKDLRLFAVISMMDSGGSNRVLRDEFGLLPTSDLRQCMVALASEESDEVLRKLFTYRYHQGIGISGMTFGNLFMAALTDIYGSQEEAIRMTCKLLQVKGEIIPVTHDNVHLLASYDNGLQILGEHFIDEPENIPKDAKLIDLKTVPNSKANPAALSSIQNADVIVLGPGDLFTSIICNLVVGDIKRTLSKSKAKIIYVNNLMTKFGQTNNFTAKDHLETIEKYLGRKVDYCLINKNHLKRQNIDWYESYDSKVVVDDLGNEKRVVRKDLLDRNIHKNTKGDVLVRSLVRHSSDKLAQTIYNLI